MLTIRRGEPCRGHRFERHKESLGQRDSVWRELFLEKIVECFAGVVRTNGRETPRRGCRRSAHSGGSRILLDCGAKRIESAIVSSVLLGDALRYRAGALELSSGIEVSALFAAVQFETATGALAAGIETWLQDGAAIRAPRARDRPYHSRSPWADLFLPRAILRGTLFLFLRGIGIHVAPVAVLPVQKLPPWEYFYG